MRQAVEFFVRHDNSVLFAWIFADSFWYQMGRWHSTRVSRLLHRISLAPDSCIRDVTTALRRHGAGTLLFAKFVPGLNFAAPPVAGLSGVSPLRFLLFDSLASVFWAGSYMVLGYTLRAQFPRIAAYSEALPTIVLALLAATAAFIGFRLLRNRRSLFSLGAGNRSRPVESKAGARTARTIGA